MKPAAESMNGRREKNLPEPVWLAMIAASSLAALLITVYCLSQGITIIFMHLMYFPIILLAYHYRYTGVLGGTLLALAYVWLVYLFEGSQFDVILGAWLRFFVFVGIAAVVAFLSEHLAANERALRASEKRYRTLFENMLEGFAYCRMIYDESGRPVDWIYLDVNKSFGDLTGLHEIRGRRVMEAIPTIRDLTPELFTTYARVASTGMPEVFEIDFKPLKMWLKVSVFSPERDHFVAVFDDITKRHEAEVALRESEEKFRRLITSAPIPLSYANSRGEIEFINTYFTRVFGYEPKDIPTLRDWFSRAYPDPDYRKEALERWNAAVTTATDRKTDIEPHEYIVTCRDGSTRNVIITGIIIGDRMLAAFVDITERKRAGDLANDNARFLETLFDTIPIPIFYKDTAGRYLGCNPPFEEFIGCTRKDLVGKTVHEIAPSDLADIYKAADDELLAGAGSQRYESRVQFADGTRHDVIFYKAPFFSHNGSVGGLIGTFVDITLLKQTEDALRMANRKLNLLSSITRHDINNQLFSLKAFLELSKEVLDDPAQLSEYLIKEERAASAIERQIGFTKEYQDLGVREPVWQVVDACVRSAVASLPLRDIRVECTTGPLEIFADPLLARVFYNLIDNALRYGGLKMTTISISAQGTGNCLIITVLDDGTGIPPEDKKQLFTKGFGKHTGLGLFLSREILSITGITITETGEPGRGARFEIRVPAGTWRHAPAS